MMMLFFILGASAALTETYRTGGIVLLFCSTLLLAHFHYANERKGRNLRVLSFLEGIAVLLSQKMQPHGWLARHPEQPEQRKPKTIRPSFAKRVLASHLLRKLSVRLHSFTFGELGEGERCKRSDILEAMDSTALRVAALLGIHPTSEEVFEANRGVDAEQYADAVIEFLGAFLSDESYSAKRAAEVLFLSTQAVREFGLLPALNADPKWVALLKKLDKTESSDEEESSEDCADCEGSNDPGCCERVDVVSYDIPPSVLPD